MLSRFRYVFLTIAIDVRSVGENGTQKISISVIDCGIGIEPSRQRDIFQSLTQIDPSDTREFGGVGMGLAVARQLSELMDGQLSVQSKPSIGSVFELQIPADIRSLEEPSKPQISIEVDLEEALEDSPRISSIAS